MTKPLTNQNVQKTKGQVILEYVLLAIILCVLALRTTFTEGPNVQSPTQPINLGSSVYSLSLSAALILSFLLWLVSSLYSKKFLYRFTAIEIGLLIFCLAAVLAGLTAANKRAAITETVCFIAPVLTAILLVQILDSPVKIKLLLTCIVALAVVSAYQCTEQLLFSNQMTIDQYEQAPQTILEPLGIQPGTFQHFMLEHRLYTRGIRGFFTTSNSAASFLLMASFAAIALFADKLKNRKSNSSRPLQLVPCALALAAVLFGFVLTKSKGAIAASIPVAMAFIALLYFRDWITKHKKAILLVCLLLAVVAATVIVRYGLTHGRLPGGNSMLVRWQYWHASAKMYADNPLTGVGPGNFAKSYQHYKPPEALESVADPHNFPLSLLTQYGPLGLLGFLAMLLIPLARPFSPRPSLTAPPSTPNFKTLAVVFAIIISAALLLIRPIIINVPKAIDFDVMIYVGLVLYVMPVLAFILGFWLLTAGQKSAHTTNTNITTAALLCACLGVILHNLIDFAIFEPGVFMPFWAIIAALLAMDYQQNSRPQFASTPARDVWKITALISVGIFGAYLYYCLIPVAKRTTAIHLANQATLRGSFRQAHNLLSAATSLDRLSPAAPALNGRLHIQEFKTSSSKPNYHLQRAEKCVLAAIARDPVDFKHFERLAEVYTLFAEISTDQEKSNWLNKAFESISSAVDRYPGSARLHLQMADIAEKLGKNSIALDHYQKTVDIEDAFRAQFKIMYPQWQLVSRLGEEKYQTAKQKVKDLSEQPTP
jgi:O-antigen ligase